MFQNNLSWAHTSGCMGVCACVCSGWVLGTSQHECASLVMNIGIGGLEGTLPFSQGLGMNLGVILLEDPVFGS